MANHQVYVVHAQAFFFEQLQHRVGDDFYGKGVNRAPVHADMTLAVDIQLVGSGALGSQHRRPDTLNSVGKRILQKHGSGAVAEQYAGCAVIPIDNAAQHFGGAHKGEPAFMPFH